MMKVQLPSTNLIEEWNPRYHTDYFTILFGGVWSYEFEPRNGRDIKEMSIFENEHHYMGTFSH